MRVLLVDDDRELAEALKKVLSAYAIDLDAAYSPSEGLQKVNNDSYDAILLDVMLPEINGFEFCRKIRQGACSKTNIPIIIVSARTELVDKVVGLETGADDYVVKPFEPRELVARIYAVLRRFRESEPDEARGDKSEISATGEKLSFRLGADALDIDNLTVEVKVNSVVLDLTAFEYDILYTLAKQPGEVISREELLKLSTRSGPVYADSLVSLIYRLRNKIRQAGAKDDFIRTVRSRGYALIGNNMP